MATRSVSYRLGMSEHSLPAEHIGTLSATTTTAPRVTVPDGPNGTRVIVTVTAAELRGPRIDAELVPATAAGDWLTIRPNGTPELDVRLCLRTGDGADVFVHYTGLIRDNADGTSGIRVTPRFQTGDERYGWLNDTFCVGIGERTDDGVRYEIYAL